MVAEVIGDYLYKSVINIFFHLKSKLKTFPRTTPRGFLAYLSYTIKDLC